MKASVQDASRLHMAAGRFRAPQLAVTVLLHLALLWLLFAALAPRVARPSAAPTYVSLVDVPPPRPQPQAVPVAQPEALPRQAPRRPKVRVRREAPVLAAEPPPPAAPDADPLAPAPSQPVFDRAAALAAARKMTHLPDPAREGTALAQFDARKMRDETEQEKLGRKIASAKRNDCIGPNASGNLLTPLFWLLDKKGGGCKF